MKIGIAGPSGAGKTTLAKYIATEFEIPYLRTKGEELRANYGYESHRDIIKGTAINPGHGYAYEIELLNQRIFLMDSSPDWVMDRTLIDSIAYAYLQLSPFVGNKDISMMLELIKPNLKNYTHIILLPPNQNGIEMDGVRIRNTYYQAMSYAMMEWVIRGYEVYLGCRVLISRDNEWEDRLRTVKEFLS